MLEEKATIIRVENAQTWVEIKGSQGCHQCGQKSSCGTSILSSLFKKEPQFFRVNNQINAKKGEQVIIGIPENIFLKASFLGFIVPLLSMIFFAMIGYQASVFLLFNVADLFAIIFGGFGLFMGLKFVTSYIEKQKSSYQYRATILRKDGIKPVMLDY